MTPTPKVKTNPDPFVVRCPLSANERLLRIELLPRHEFVVAAEILAFRQAMQRLRDADEMVSEDILKVLPKVRHRLRVVSDLDDLLEPSQAEATAEVTHVDCAIPHPLR